MYEVTMQELSVFVVLGFMAGVFASFYLTRFFEVVHMWRLNERSDCAPALDVCGHH
jgi:H+/Cl- antiporter ClcA